MEYVRWAKMFQLWYRNLVQKISSFVKPKKIVDIGCGPGILMEELMKYFPEALIVGIDRDVEMCKMSKAILCDARSLPFRDATFDLAIFCYSLHEIGLLALYEARRVLKDDGILVVRDVRSEMTKIARDFLLFQLSLNVGVNYAEKVRSYLEVFPNSTFIRKFVEENFEVLHFSSTPFDFDLIARKL
ncbi:MAG: class I SAM-dependent methyltransferase [Archaeoglobaceae archaeon]|nr:class I SAM-dependent methyltransferase [Archaeoglobaceae archaeon]MCX8152286.1 class I SAM-dependent methyltransferase [Archaeoglobaceae archaeon]MDW8013964.1 class I SAM-dependent methyltransferase [Archaeoglobaceae archaeon]